MGKLEKFDCETSQRVVTNEIILGIYSTGSHDKQYAVE